VLTHELRPLDGIAALPDTQYNQFVSPDMMLKISCLGAKLRLIVVCIWISFLLSNSLSWAQSEDEVHIVARPALQRHGAVDAETMNGGSLPSPAKPIRVAVDLVQVPVVVTDALNRPVVNLKKQDFALFEGDKPQEIRNFATDQAPISIAVLFDVSKSMTDKIDTERVAIRRFIENANPEDEYFAISFSDCPRLLDGPTQSADDVEQKLTSIEPGGSTSLLDAIYLAESQLESARYQRKAIVIFSDGGDNASRYTLRDIKKLVAECDAQIYAVGLFETFFFNTVEERLGKKWLSEITDKTGGRTITVENRDKLPQVAAEISWELRNEYLLSYKPSLFDGKWHKIKVHVSSPTAEHALHAYYKKGYYSVER
jgi:Ca-activated chloride channel homolog